MTNPLDGYRDVNPWPYHWSRDIHEGPISALTLISLLYDRADYWTYENHWSVFGPPSQTPKSWITDIYWSTEDEERLQMPPDIGDQIATILVAHKGGKILRVIWMGQIWSEGQGWQPWHGEQGDFVDHLHVEWKEYADYP